MSIDFSNRTRTTVDRKLAVATLDKLLAHYRLSGQHISVVVVGDRAMRTLNNRFRHKDRPTDVLSFASRDTAAVDPLDLGELIIDWQQIIRQAPRFGQRPKRELVYILTHGFLHLLGYDDKSSAEAEAMKVLGEKLISRLKL
ncbi:MAG: rRNA maturation RNase YbeY [Candidatus Falkowbacteria bacterium]